MQPYYKNSYQTGLAVGLVGGPLETECVWTAGGWEHGKVGIDWYYNNKLVYNNPDIGKIFWMSQFLLSRKLKLHSNRDTRNNNQFD